MKADPFRPLPTQEEYARDLGYWPDMAQLEAPEPKERSRPVLAWLILAIAIVLACLIGLAGCTETVERESYAPLTSIRPEARP